MENAGGKLYPTELLDPPVPCPVCGDAISGWVNARALSVPPRMVGGLKGAMGFIPDSALRSSMVYTLHPCGCEVIDMWASALADEMKRRQQRQPPRSVSLQAVVLVDQRKTQLRYEYQTLCGVRDAAAAAGQLPKKTQAERDICILLRELKLLDPAAVVPRVVLEKEVVAWAKQYTLPLPPGNDLKQDGQAAPPEITLPQIRAALQADPRFRDHVAERLTDAARTIYFQLQDLARKGTPVDEQAAEIIIAIVPDAARFLKTKAVATPIIDPDPNVEFARRLAARRSRRVDLNDKENL